MIHEQVSKGHPWCQIPGGYDPGEVLGWNMRKMFVFFHDSYERFIAFMEENSLNILFG